MIKAMYRARYAEVRKTLLLLSFRAKRGICFFTASTASNGGVMAAGFFGPKNGPQNDKTEIFRFEARTSE